MASNSLRLLVVDDEPDLRTLYELTLVREGYDVDVAGTVQDAWLRLCESSYGAVITDMRLPDGTGLDLLHRMEAAGRSERAIVITAYGSAENAVEALKAGAFDYLTKPVDLRQFRLVVASAMGRMAMASSAVPASTDPSDGPSSRQPGQRRVAATSVDSPASGDGLHPALAALIGPSESMRQVRTMIERVARGMAPVLVQGESGTGKELVARAIHGCSTRASHAFVAVNCSAIPEQLLEAEFFGYRRGAFTGAVEDRAGFFQTADGGTLFLDEIGDLPLVMQSKLLRAIQERSVRPLGAMTEQPVNVRVVSATHKDLASEVAEGRFRQDLYYRINVIQIRMPALRERMGDLAAICDALLSRIAKEAGVAPAPRLVGDAIERLSRYGFPGNVRELENLLHRAVALSSDDAIHGGDLGLSDDVFAESEYLSHESAHARLETGVKPATADDAAMPADLVAHLDHVEREILLRALERHRFNRTAAGASLGLSLRQMRYRMARLGINVADHLGDRPESSV